MSKERELLKRVLDTQHTLSVQIGYEIEELLAQPEPTYTLDTSPPKREPLSDGEITDLWANKSPANEFECVRLVEKAHGITGGGE